MPDECALVEIHQDFLVKVVINKTSDAEIFQHLLNNASKIYTEILYDCCQA